MKSPDAIVITCEHGGNRIPPRYRELFRGHEALLRTHRGYDAGALRMARDMAEALASALESPLAMMAVSTISRLLIDLNRSPGHPGLYSDATRAASAAIREEIFRRHYLPYRGKVEHCIAGAIAGGARVIHLSCHSFTPELDGDVRNADIGLLYDPAREAESELCRRWRVALQVHASGLRTRMNYPYSGTADGFTTHLRRRFPGDAYLGIELEINQKHVLAHGRHWQEVRRGVVQAFQHALLEEKEPRPVAGAQGMRKRPAPDAH